MDDYLNRENYFELLNSCSCAIYGFTEQQAIGNIYQMFRTGKKVFFFKDSKMYNYFKESDLNIFDVDNISIDVFDSTLDNKSQRINFDFVINDENYEEYIKVLHNFIINNYR